MTDGHVAFDFETYFSKKEKCTVRGSTPMQYVRHPRFDAYLVSACDGQHEWAGHPRDFNWNALDGRVVVAHNSKFEDTVWHHLHSIGVCPKPNPKALHCTADMSVYLTMHRELKAAVQALLGETISKQTREDAEGKGWDDFSPAFQKEMLLYAKSDARRTWRLWAEHSHKWPALEQRLSTQNRIQNRRGVRIDVERLDRQLIALTLALAEVVKMIPWMADIDDADEDDPEWGEVWDGAKKPTSTKALVWQCQRCGIPNPPAKTKDPEGYEEWFAEYGRKHEWVSYVSAWRSINMCLKQHKTIKERLVDGDILPFSLKYFGAHTGRWSGDGGFNIQNPRKEAIIIDQDYFPYIDGPRYREAVKCKKVTGEWPKWVKVVVDLRALVIPRNGKKMIISDLSQIEPRIINWLAGNFEFLELVKTMSPYQAYAKLYMGYTGDNLKKEDPVKYAYAKATVLALGFGCGWKKFIVMAQDLADLDVTEGDPETEQYEDPRTGGLCVRDGYGTQSRKIVNAFRAANPRIVSLWGALEDNLRQSVGSDAVIRLPNGRAMTYREVRETRRQAIAEDSGRGYLKRVLTAQIGHRRVETYGGKLAENATQATARDVFAEFADVLHESLLFSAHDEAVLEVDLDVDPRDIEQTMSKTPDWLPGCPVAAEATEAAHYKK